jgi:hypothetical protein
VGALDVETKEFAVGEVGAVEACELVDEKEVLGGGVDYAGLVVIVYGRGADCVDETAQEQLDDLRYFAAEFVVFFFEALKQKSLFYFLMYIYISCTAKIRFIIPYINFIFIYTMFSRNNEIQCLKYEAKRRHAASYRGHIIHYKIDDFDMYCMYAVSELETKPSKLSCKKYFNILDERR